MEYTPANMRLLGVDDELLRTFHPAKWLLDAAVEKIAITAVNLEPVIEILFQPIRRSAHRILIRFSGVSEFYFNHESEIGFYYVASYKFFRAPTGFYLSLDPHSESERIEADDNNIILCKSISGFEEIQ